MEATVLIAVLIAAALAMVLGVFVKDPSAIAAKQIRNLTAAIPEVEAGVLRVTESPMAKAAERLDVAGTNYMKAIASGKMARNLRAVTTEEWQRKTVAKVGHIAEGIAAAEDRLVQFHTQRNAAQVGIDRELAGIPRRTLADSIRRMTVQVTSMSKFSFDKSKR